MYAVIVKAHVIPEKKEAFMKEMLADGEGSIAKEDGCLLFNIIENSEDPNLIHLYEVYKSAAAFETHQQTEHFTRWVETTSEWLAKPLEIATGNHLFPSDSIWTKQQ